MEFQTLGLPRTRSRWLSFLLSTENADCYHDALSLTGSTILPHSKKMYVGSCDTNPMNYTYSNRPLIIIERDKEDVVNSMLKAFDNPFDKPFEPFLERFINRLNEYLKKIKGYRIKYKELNDIDRLMFICKYLKPDEDLDTDHISKIVQTVITVKERNIKPAFKHLANHLYKIEFNKLYDRVIKWQ
jgi:hypothetical protein